MEIVKQYISDDEKIIIAKHQNGKYYNHYGCLENFEIGAHGTAGGFETLEEAESMLKKHRSMAVEIK